MGNMPNSPRQGSRSARGGSKRDNYSSKMDSQAAKTMPLTHGQDLKPITVSATGWKPVSVAQDDHGSQPPGRWEPDPQRPDGPAHGAAQSQGCAQQDDAREVRQDLGPGPRHRPAVQRRGGRPDPAPGHPADLREGHGRVPLGPDVRQVLQAHAGDDEPRDPDTTILDRSGNVVNGGALFRKYLLNRCQEEFERGWKTDLPKPKEGESKEAVILSDDYYVAAAAKRRGLGLVQFIGELYKLGMLTERIMHECVRKLVDYQGTPDEAEIESLSKLLRTIGANLDNTEKGKPMMDAYFTRIQNIVDLPELPSRLKFMLMDIIDLRRRNWISNDTNKGPKTLDEVRQEAEAAAAQKAAENARSSQRGPCGQPAEHGPWRCPAVLQLQPKPAGSQPGRHGRSPPSQGLCHPQLQLQRDARPHVHVRLSEQQRAADPWALEARWAGPARTLAPRPGRARRRRAMRLLTRMHSSKSLPLMSRSREVTANQCAASASSPTWRRRTQRHLLRPQPRQRSPRLFPTRRAQAATRRRPTRPSLFSFPQQCRPAYMLSLCIDRAGVALCIYGVPKTATSSFPP